MIYHYVVARSLTCLTAQIEKAVLWLELARVGALNNYTFDRLPIQRLTPHDINAETGAIPTLISIVLVILICASGQIWAFRREGRVIKYLLLCLILAGGLFGLSLVPGCHLRLHHYILALLLLPGTSVQTRLSLAYQGLLVGLFINGIARWGLGSILQTPSELVQDGPRGTMLPNVAVLAVWKQNITFLLGPLSVYDPKLRVTPKKISVLVNDVQRARVPADDSSPWQDRSAGGDSKWTWNSHRRDQDAASPLPEYFRFGFLDRDGNGDYTKAGLPLGAQSGDDAELRAYLITTSHAIHVSCDSCLPLGPIAPFGLAWA